MAARGDIRGLPAILTGAGIAERNVRYATLIARHEARRVEAEEGPPSDPLHDAVVRLDDRRRRLLRDTIDIRYPDLPVPASPSDDIQVSDESIAALNAWIDHLVALPDDEVAAAEAAVEAELQAISERRSIVPLPPPSDQGP